MAKDMRQSMFFLPKRSAIYPPNRRAMASVSVAMALIAPRMNMEAPSSFMYGCA